jgi:hypothetical protein
VRAGAGRQKTRECRRLRGFGDLRAMRRESVRRPPGKSDMAEISLKGEHPENSKFSGDLPIVDGWAHPSTIYYVSLDWPHWWQALLPGKLPLVAEVRWH